MRATAQVVSPLRVCGGFRLSFCCCGGQLTVTVTVTAQVVRACNYAGSVRTDTALPSRAITTLPLRTKLPPPPRARTPPSLPSREHRPPLGIAHKHRALTLRKHHPPPTREHRPFIAQDLRPLRAQSSPREHQTRAQSVAEAGPLGSCFRDAAGGGPGGARNTPAAGQRALPIQTLPCTHFCLDGQMIDVIGLRGTAPYLVVV